MIPLLILGGVLGGIGIGWLLDQEKPREVEVENEEQEEQKETEERNEPQEERKEETKTPPKKERKEREKRQTVLVGQREEQKNKSQTSQQETPKVVYTYDWWTNTWKLQMPDYYVMNMDGKYIAPKELQITVFSPGHFRIDRGPSVNIKLCKSGWTFLTRLGDELWMEGSRIF